MPQTYSSINLFQNEILLAKINQELDEILNFKDSFHFLTKRKNCDRVGTNFEIQLKIENLTKYPQNLQL